MLFMVSYPLLNWALSLSFPSAKTAQPLLRQTNQIALVLGVSSRIAWSTVQVSRQPRLSTKTVAQNKTKQKPRKNILMEVTHVSVGYFYSL